mmetsp:Transcript_83265/g.222599  ORF Transcript_83265/g.222599 Transcript_83265/m.222599 type:complete len:86 (-) Transcript_83265:45-302(-)
MECGSVTSGPTYTPFLKRMLEGSPARAFATKESGSRRGGCLRRGCDLPDRSSGELRLRVAEAGWLQGESYVRTGFGEVDHDREEV